MRRAPLQNIRVYIGADKSMTNMKMDAGRLRAPIIRRSPAQGDMEIPESDVRRRLGFTFDIMTDGQTVLYTPAQPVRVNHDAILLYNTIPA